jgi:hypothetical protein
MILLALDGQMGDEQFVEFDRLLREDLSFRQYYLRFMAVNASLGAIDKFPAARIVEEDDAVLSRDLWNELAREEQTAETIEIEIPKQKPAIIKKDPIGRSPRKINKFSLISALMSAAALAVLIMYVHFAPVKTASLVGKLSKTIDAQWQDASGQITQGCDLYSGPMSLIAGYAEITLDGGAIVVVQAPSQFALESAQQLFLQKGQIVARKNGGGEQAFLVRTPHASIVDYGTEFGVRVDSAGQTETYVYEGQVQMRDSSNPIKFMKSLSLKAGQGAVADSESNMAGKDVDAKTFVRPDELDIRYRAQKDNGFYRWRASIYRLHRDPSLVAHYFFEQPKTNPDRLVNAAFPEQRHMQGVFGDENRNKPAWVQGRWPQKQAVRFERDKKQVILIPPEASLSVTYPLTISTWVFFPNKDKWGGHLVSCRKDQRINYQFSLFDKNYSYGYQQNRFEFRQYEVLDKEGVGLYSQPFVPEPAVWYHFAAVYDGAELRFYVNGTLFESAPYKPLSKAVPAEIIIGAVKKDGGYAFEEGDFDGVVDELMLFNRDLSEQEIQAIYTAGKP